MNEDISMSITFWLTDCLFFMVLVDLWKGLSGICVILRMSSHSYHTVLLQKYPTLHCHIFIFLSNSLSVIGRSAGSIWTSLQTSLIIWESLTELCFIEMSTTTQFACEAVIQSVCLFTKYSGVPFIFQPYIMQMACLNF